MRTGISKSNISILVREYKVDKENLIRGCPRKLTSIDQQATITIIKIEKTPTAEEISTMLFFNYLYHIWSGIYTRREGTSHISRRKDLFSLYDIGGPDSNL